LTGRLASTGFGGQDGDNPSNQSFEGRTKNNNEGKQLKKKNSRVRLTGLGFFFFSPLL
jgi:hypothetical protein